jgi:hypothetical protein
MPNTTKVTNPELILKRYFAAMNAGDTDTALALFADDAVRLDTAEPHLTVVGRSQIERGLIARVADHIYIETSEYQVQENRASCLAKVFTDYGRRLGFAPVVEVAEIVVGDDVIQRFTVTVTPESLARIQRAEAHQ